MSQIGVTQYSNVQAAPRWAGDFGGREHVMPFPAKIDPSQFTDGLGVPLVVANAGAAAGAVTVPLTTAITGLDKQIPIGYTLSIGPANSKKFIKLAGPAANGDTSLTVEQLATALVSGDTATYSRFGAKSLKSGTYVGRTYTERDNYVAFGPATYTDDERYLVLFDCPNLLEVDDITLYRHDSLVKENFLPDWTAGANISGNAQLLAALRSDYQCIKGIA